MEGFNGSYMFEPLSLYLGISLDQVNFIMVQLFGIGFGNFFRCYLTSKKIGIRGRHFVEFIVGFAMLFFCFGSKAYILSLQTAITYLLILTLPHSCGTLSLIACMLILAACHWGRLYYDPFKYITVDMTGPLMINTQRITSLAFGIADGWKNNLKNKKTQNHVTISSQENKNSPNGDLNHYQNNNLNQCESNNKLNNKNVYNCIVNGATIGNDIVNCALNRSTIHTNGFIANHNHAASNEINMYNNKNEIIKNNNKDTISNGNIASDNTGKDTGGKFCEENQFLLSKNINKVPSALEMLSYTYCFHTVICGPFSYYHDYVNFIEEQIPKTDGQQNKDFSYSQLNPQVNIMKNMSAAFVLILLSLFLGPLFDMSKLTDEGFARSLGTLKVCLYVLVISHVAKFKYYVAWKLADAMNSNVGLSFNGWNEEGREKWDKIKNVDIMKVETSTNLQMVFKHWNKTTASWLRYTIYERTKSTYLVFAVSALWHGFFPGYYISFISGAFFISVSRLARKLIRPYFVPQRHSSLSESSIVYDVITCLVTKVQMAYLGSAFLLLDFSLSIKFYSDIYFIVHFINILAFVILLVINKRIQNKRK